MSITQISGELAIYGRTLGSWSGAWTHTVGSNDLIMLGLQQRGASVGKTALFQGNECLTTSNATGIVSGNSTDLTVQSGMEIIELDASIDSSARTLTERRTCAASTLPCCDGETGNL